MTFFFKGFFDCTSVFTKSVAEMSFSLSYALYLASGALYHVNEINIILYCHQGGLKAVIWTDVFQSMIMVAGLITVVIVGSIEVGGFDKVWQINKEFNRLNFFE